MDCVRVSCQHVPWSLQGLAGSSKIWGSSLGFTRVEQQLKMLLCWEKNTEKSVSSFWEFSPVDLLNLHCWGAHVEARPGLLS